MYMRPFWWSADLADSAEISAAMGPYFLAFIFRKSSFFAKILIGGQEVNRQTNPFGSKDIHICLLFPPNGFGL